MALISLPLADAGPINGIVPSVIVLLSGCRIARACGPSRTSGARFRAGARLLRGRARDAGDRAEPPGRFARRSAAGRAHGRAPRDRRRLRAADRARLHRPAARAAAAPAATIGKLRVFAHPLVAFPVWAINFYAWHLAGALPGGAPPRPASTRSSMRRFLAFGMAMWMALLGPLPKPAWFGNAARLVYIIAVRLARDDPRQHHDLLGVRSCTRSTAPATRKWHISPMGDQIAAAGLMMVEESLLTIGLFCWLFLQGRARVRGAPGRCSTPRPRTGSSSTSSARRGPWRRGAATSCSSGSRPAARAPRCPDASTGAPSNRRAPPGAGYGRRATAPPIAGTPTSAWIWSG